MSHINYLYSGRKDRADISRIEAGEMHDGNYFGMLRLHKLGHDTDLLQVEDIFSTKFCKWLRNHISIHFIHLPLLISPRFWRSDAIVSGGALGLLVVWAIWPFSKPKWVAIDFNLAGTIAGKTTIRQRILAWALGKVNAVVCIAEAEVRELLERVPELAGRISFAHEGVDLNFFAPSVSIQKQSKLIASVGADRGRDFNLVVASAKSAGVFLEIAAPPRHIAKLGTLPEGISGRMLSHIEVRNLYNRAICAAVILKPTGPADSMGTLAIIEAMASGIPVVATDIPSVRSYIQNGVNGTLVPEGNEAALAAAFRVLTNDPDHAALMGAAARKAAMANFGADKFAAAIDKAIKD